MDTTDRSVRDPALVDRVRSRLAAAGGDTTPAAVAAAVRAEAGGVASDLDVLAALRLLRQEFVGAGPLDELLRDPRTTDVLVSGPASVWVDRGAGLEPSGLRFPDEAAVRRLAQRLAVAAGRRLDDASPYVDGWLADAGVRLHAVLSPVAVDGTCLSLRVLRPAAHDLATLRALGTVDAAGEALLRAVLSARLAFLVSGGTGTGKTTILAALLSAVDPQERLLVVEDAEELRPRHPHVVRLVARPANIEGAGGVTAARPGPAGPADAPGPAGRRARSAGPRCAICWPRSTPATTAARAPCTPTRWASCRPGWRPWPPSAACRAPRCTASSQPRCRWCCTCDGIGSGARVFAAAGVLARGAGGEVRVRPVWTRRDGWGDGRAALGELLADRGVSAPW